MRNLILTSILTAMVFAVTAIPSALQLSQPDGTEFEARLLGDEWQHWVENSDGFTIARNTDAEWVIVEAIDDGEYVLSNFPAHQPHSISGLEPHLRPPVIPHDMELTAPDLSQVGRTEFQVPLLLIDYPNMPGSYPLETFMDLMNMEGWETSHGETGSFRDFYLENSYGQFDPNTTIYGWFTADEPHNVYGSDAPDGWNMVRQMIRDAVDDAEAAGVDWTQFDNDGDGNVDALNVIHAGFGAEEGDGSNVWSHRWALGQYAVEYDGVWINDYTINPEKQGMNNTPTIVNIGVICHEFGHALGLPDLYDTDYSSTGIGTWGLMASGSWGGNGNSAWYPSHFSAWCKVRLGWVDPIVISDGSITIDIPNAEENPVVYKMNGLGPDHEYWLFENRQQILFDQTQKNSGLLIWHIDESMNSNQNDWHYLVDVEQADGYYDLNNNRDSDGGDSWPGTLGRTEFTDYTTPNTRLYNDEPSGIGILGIVEDNMIVTANFRNHPTIYVNDFNLEETDGDNDQVLNPGEVGSISSIFFNPSDEDIYDLTAIVTSDDPAITILTEEIQIDDLFSFSSSQGGEFLFDVAEDAELGAHSVQFNLSGVLGNGDLYDQITTLTFPVTINQFGFPTNEQVKVISSPLVVDIDESGTNEVIYGDYDGFIYLLNEDGTLYSDDWPFDTGNQIWGSPAAADIDNDGEIEIIVNSKSKNLFILDRFAEVEAEYYAGQFLVGTPVIANMDDDDDLEIAFGGFSSAGQLFAINPDGSDLAGYPVPLNEKVFSGVAAADFNNNDRADIVLGTDAGHIFLILDDGSIAENFPAGEFTRIRSAPSLADLNGDGIPEIIFGADDSMLRTLTVDGNILWEHDCGSVVRTSPSIIEEGGIVRIFTGTDDGRIVGLDAYGNELYGWPVETGQPIKSSMVFADHDNDNMLEVIGANKGGDLLIYSMDGNPEEGFPMPIGQSIEGSPMVADLDADGDVELISGSDSGLNVVDWKSPGTVSNWSMYRGNEYRTGLAGIFAMPLMPGDVNFDTAIDVLDVVTVLFIVVEGLEPTISQLYAGDMNADGVLDVADIVILVSIILE